MLENIKKLIDILKKARKEKGISQSMLAQKTGMPQSHISKIESGQVNVGLDSFIEMARILDLEVILVPRQSITTVKGLVASRRSEKNRSAYMLEDEDA